MGQAAEAFGRAERPTILFSKRIQQSMATGEAFAREICDPVRNFNDPSLLAALRQTFSFLLRGAISLHRKGRQPSFWEGSPEQVQTNFCAQTMQLCAVVLMSRFLEETRASIEWQSLAETIPSEVRPDRHISAHVARQYSGVFAHTAGPDRILARALPRVLPEGEDDLAECLKALAFSEWDSTPHPENSALPQPAVVHPPVPVAA